MSDHNRSLLEAILSVLGRIAFPPEKLAPLVLSKGAGPKQLDAFNLCDGTRSQGEIAKMLNIDAGNFSKTVARWIHGGIVFRIGDGRDAKLVSLYRLEPVSKKRKRKKKGE